MRPRSLTFLVLSVVLSSATLCAPAASAQASERLTADTPKATVLGNTFIAPIGWSIRVKGPATILEAPEGDSWIALVDVQASTADEALATAWKTYRSDAKWPIKVSHDLPDRDGWSRRHSHEYLTSPNEKRTVYALVEYSGSNWTVVIEDMTDAVTEKRGGQEALVLGRCSPRGTPANRSPARKPTRSTRRALPNSAASSSRVKKKPAFPEYRSA